MDYNLSPFNMVGYDKQEPIITMYCAEKVEADVKSYTNIALQMIGTEHINQESIMSGGTPISFNFNERMLFDSIMTSSCIEKFILSEKINNTAKISENISLILNLEEKTKVDAYLSENIDFFEEFSGEIRVPSLYGSKNIIHQTTSLFETLDVNTMSIVLNESITKINVTILPGETLIINSDDYTANINGENILSRYEGDWHYISRNSEKINISASNGAHLKGKIIYRERFL